MSFMKYLVGMATESEKVPGSFVRQALSRGIGIETGALEANPYAFGFIGSSDTHVSAPSLSEEEHFGKFSHDTDLANRGSVPPDGKKSWDNVATEETELAFISSASYGASGLAGVWAESNTREDIFDAMKRKETFATSGPRIKARFFAGNYENTILSSTKMLEEAYEQGTPMGGVYNGKNESPVFIAWAVKDPDGYPSTTNTNYKGLVGWRLKTVKKYMIFPAAKGVQSHHLKPTDALIMAQQLI